MNILFICLLEYIKYFFKKINKKETDLKVDIAP